jgi:hypothetical protein
MAIDDVLGATRGLRIARRFLTDEKFPDPVIPEGLDQVKPAAIDAEGRVECIYCHHPVAHAQASLIGPEGYACPRCVHRFTAAPAALPDDVRIKRGPVPYLIAIGVVAAIAGIIAIAST